MLLVFTKIGPSTIHGLGLFADQFIPKGTPTWRYEPGFDVTFTQEELEKMSDPTQKQMLWYAYFDAEMKKYVLCSDDQRFINHAANPDLRNIETTPNEDIAARDIQPGEELLCDYNMFDPAYFTRHGLNDTTLV